MAGLFEYAVYKDERRDRDGNVTEEAKLLVEPSHMMAKDINQVNLKVARLIPESELEDADRIQIVVRPF